MKRFPKLHCKGAKSCFRLGDFAVLFPRTVHFRQSFSVSVFSVCSCSNSLVAACRARSWRLCSAISENCAFSTKFFRLCFLSLLLFKFFGCGLPRQVLATLQCYFRELCIFDKVFPSLFSQFAPVQILWLRLAPPGLCDESPFLSEKSVKSLSAVASCPPSCPPSRPP